MTDSTITEKICGKCNQLLPTQHFYKESARPDGYGIYCKSCMSQYRTTPLPKPIINLPDEKWVICIEDDRYAVSNMGRVKRVKFNRYTRQGEYLLIPQMNKHGYLHITFSPRTKVRVHRLVCVAFHGEPQDGQTDCNHIDFDRTNNRADNLEWKTRKENLHHSKNVGRDNKGERNGQAVLQSDQVRQIKHLLATTNMKHGDIGALFGVTDAAIQQINVGRNWKHIK